MPCLLCWFQSVTLYDAQNLAENCVVVLHAQVKVKASWLYSFLDTRECHTLSFNSVASKCYQPGEVFKTRIAFSF